jgi:hypothetical protein
MNGEMISQWDALLEIQSLEDVLAVSRVLAEASFKFSLSCRADWSCHVPQ